MIPNKNIEKKEKKKRRKRTLDKAKIAENKKKAKAKKLRQREQLKEEKARRKAERRLNKELKKSGKAEETLAVKDNAVVESLVKTEEKMHIEDMRVTEEAYVDEARVTEAAHVEKTIMEEVHVEEIHMTEEAYVEETRVTEAVYVDEAKIAEEVPIDEEEVTEEVYIDEMQVTEAAYVDETQAAEDVHIDETYVAEEAYADKAQVTEETHVQETGIRETCVTEKTVGSGKETNKEKSKKKNKEKNRETNIETKGKRRILGIVGAAAAFLLIAGTGAFFGVRHYLTQLRIVDEAVEAMVHTEAVELAENSLLRHKKDYVKKHAGKIVPRSLVDAARFVIDGVRNRPPEVELTEENAADFAEIESCVINTQTGKVDVTMSAEGLAVSDDGYYYLFEEKAYENALTGEEYIIEDQKDVDLTFSVNLNYNSANSRLFSKFVVAVKKDGKFMAISRPRHITNPEAIARYSPSFGNTSSKKGLLVDPEKLRGSELDDLGVKHAAYNIPLSRILGGTTHAHYPTVYYTYNGRNYAFNGQVVAEYDYIFSTLSNKGITITAIILNDIHPGYMELIHPKARSGGAGSPYFAFNATDEAGTEYIAAVGSFLANRYSGSGHGKVMNWVIGNEINARKEWNYIEPMGTEQYVEEYAKAFRIFYNAILSINGNARVYISLDQQWAKSLYSNGGFGSKEILDEFNRNITAGGNIDWGVAQHPYNYPLTSVKAWSSGSKVVNSETTPVITIKNIHVLTDYLQKEHFLTDSGEVRHVILSEMGYTSSAGQDLQAAAFVYAYKVIEANRYIDSMLFSRQTDAPAELAQGLALGIDTLGGGHKSIYNAFKYVDTAESAKHTDFALRVIGVGSWGEIISRH